MGGGKLLSSKISFSRILLLFVCCIVCNNVFAQVVNDWRLVQDFESLTSNDVKACQNSDNNEIGYAAGDVLPSTIAKAEIIPNVEGHGKVGQFQIQEGYGYKGHQGIVFSVNLGSKSLSDYSNIRFDIHYIDGDCLYKNVIVAVRNGSSGPFTQLASKSNNVNSVPTQWETVTFDGFSSDRSNFSGYSNFEMFISVGNNTNPLIFQIDNIRLDGPAIPSSPVEIEIDETKNNTITAKKYDTVRLYRTLTADTWNTICLPFVPTEDQAKTIFGTTAKFAEFSSVSNGVMQFTSVDVKDLHAGTPYLVLPSQDKTTVSPIELTDVNITATSAGEVPIGNYTFKGIYSPEPFEKDDYTIRFVGTGNQLLYPNKSNSLKALRAYFIVGASNGAKNYTFAVDSFVPTSIANIQIEGDGDGAIYNIGGQRVEGKSLPKGIYIREGKKFVVK